VGFRSGIEAYPYDFALDGPSVCRGVHSIPARSNQFFFRFDLWPRTIARGFNLFAFGRGRRRKREVYRFIGRFELPAERHNNITRDALSCVPQVLMPAHFNWIRSGHGHVPEHAVEAGRTTNGEVLYVGRTYHNGISCVGKVR